MKRDYEIDYSIYSFKADDDWGCYVNGVYRKPWFNKHGYSVNGFKDTDGKKHQVMEHVVKWIYFNGEIPEGYEIDHIIPVKNGGTNKLSNLRLVTHRENCNNPISKENYSKAHLGKKFTEEHKKNLGKCHIGNKNTLGKKHSDESKRKISESQKNRIDISKKVYKYNQDNELVGEYPSAAEAARQNGFSKCYVWFKIKAQKRIHGYLYSYESL